MNLLAALLLACCLLSSIENAHADLVITGLVAYPSTSGPSKSTFNVIQLTACSAIGDLTQYSVNEYSGTNANPYQTVAFQNNSQASSVSVTKGATIYLSQLPIANFTKFFGFTPSHYFTASFNFIGTTHVALVYQGTKVVDVYGVIGVEFADTKADFGTGWVVRIPYVSATPTFNVSEWVVKPGAYNTFPVSDAKVENPVMWGNFTCGSGSGASASAPSGSPKPSQAERTGGHDSVGHRRRPPVAPSIGVTPAPSPSMSSQLPVQPTLKPHNPPRAPGNPPPRGPTLGPTPGPTTGCIWCERQLREDVVAMKSLNITERRRLCRRRQLVLNEGRRLPPCCC